MAVRRIIKSLGRWVKRSGPKYPSWWPQWIGGAGGPFQAHLICTYALLGAVAMQVIILVGCTSVASLTSRQAYLVSFSYNQKSADSHSSSRAWANITSLIAASGSTADVEVRSSFFGNCIWDSKSWICGGEAQSVVLDDPLDLFSYAETYKEHVIFPGLLIGSVIFGFACAFTQLASPNWHWESIDSEEGEIEVKPFPPKGLLWASFYLACFSTTMSLISVLWQHTSAMTIAAFLPATTLSLVEVRLGTLALALNWASVGLYMAAGLWTWVTMLSMDVLDRLSWEE